ncbi:MAG: cytochrome P450 [Gemmatimonadaceae bacterium]
MPELILLALIALPLARVAFHPGLRRRFSAFPPIQALLLLALATYGIGILGAFFFVPIVMRPAAVAAAALIVYELFQRRPGLGTDRGLPPGSLAYFPMGPWRDPDFFRKSAARLGPVFKFRHLSRPAVAIVGLELISEFLQSHATDLSSPPASFNTLVPGGFVRYLGDSEHLDTAAMLRSAISRAVVEQCSDDVNTEARIAVGVLARDEYQYRRAVDSMMLHVMMRCFLGLGRGADLNRFRELYRTADYRRLATTGKPRARQATGEIIREIRTLSARQDLGCSFLSELAKAHPQALSSDTMMGSFAYALHTARVDATGLMIWMLAVLGENEHWISTLRTEYASNPEAGETGGLADRIVRETLRLRQSEFIIRRARKRIDWNGLTIPEGWHVRLCVAESHRLANAFETPDRFDPDRFLKTPTRSRYAPFGFAPHLCPGEHLTRWIGRKLLVELARSHDIRSSDVQPWEFGGFHWRPNRAMKITLSPANV